MGLSLSDCANIIGELRGALVGGFLQKIHQPGPLILTLDIRAAGQTCPLLVCVEPQFARLHLISRKLKNPPTPPPFCLFLRSHVEGGRITEIKQEPGDRVVYFTIQKAGQVFLLVIALTGKHANMHVLNEARVVLRSLRNSRLKLGEPYMPPALKPDTQLNSSPLKSPPPPAITSHLPLDGTVAHKNGELRGRIPEAIVQENELKARYPVSAELEARYSQLEQEEGQDVLLQQQLAQVRKSLKHGKRKIRALQEDFKKAERYREYARYGELLKSHLHEMKKGQEAITLVDYYDPALPALTLPLDPSKDAVWNMENYFKKYQKFLGAQKHLQPRLDQANREVLHLEAQLAQLEQDIVNPNVLLKIKKILETKVSSRLSKSKSQQPPAKGYRIFTSADGIPILVGKTAKDNDWLTFKIANPHDLWLHARGTPGSHVVVRLDKNAAVPLETLKDAATLTLWFSDLRKSGKGEVIYTSRKFVRKVKGQKPGAVMVDWEKSLWIEVKKERLERLKLGTN